MAIIELDAHQVKLAKGSEYQGLRFSFYEMGTAVNDTVWASGITGIKYVAACYAAGVGAANGPLPVFDAAGDITLRTGAGPPSTWYLAVWSRATTPQGVSATVSTATPTTGIDLSKKLLGTNMVVSPFSTVTNADTLINVSRVDGSDVLYFGIDPRNDDPGTGKGGIPLVAAGSMTILGTFDAGYLANGGRLITWKRGRRG